MAIEVFNRHEKKYRLSEAAFFHLQRNLACHMQLDAHCRGWFTYPICNIYYDTPDSHLITASLQKPVYKEKLRLRCYETPSLDAMVYVEIKKKYKGVVNKRRSALRLYQAYDFLESGLLPATEPFMNAQVLREIQYLLTRQPLQPKVFLSYDRLAFSGAGDSDLRVSFDTNIRARRSDLRLESGVYGAPLLGPGEWLMEIKTSESIPLWLTGLLSEYRIYPSSFSKYGTEFQRREERKVLYV